MPREYIREKWLQYFKTLREDLSAETLKEARDAFYGGVIGAMSILEKTRGAAADDMYIECHEYLEMLKCKLEELNRGTQTN
jgi:hypothetical protein